MRLDNAVVELTLSYIPEAEGESKFSVRKA
jgi:hypothetical protein